jgi:hypothetical protein
VSIEGTDNIRVPPERRYVEDDRVKPVREENEEIENERAAVLDVVANEGARLQVLPERRYIPGPRSSRRLHLRVSGDSPPKRTRRGARGAEDQTTVKKHQDHEVDRYFAQR